MFVDICAKSSDEVNLDVDPIGVKNKPFSFEEAIVAFQNTKTNTAHNSKMQLSWK